MNAKLTPADLEYVLASDIVLGDVLVNWKRKLSDTMNMPPTQAQLNRKSTSRVAVYHIAIVPTTSGTATNDHNIWINGGEAVYAGPLNDRAASWQVPAREWRVRKA